MWTVIPLFILVYLSMVCVCLCVAPVHLSLCQELLWHLILAPYIMSPYPPGIYNLHEEIRRIGCYLLNAFMHYETATEDAKFTLQNYNTLPWIMWLSVPQRAKLEIWLNFLARKIMNNFKTYSPFYIFISKNYFLIKRRFFN